MGSTKQRNGKIELLRFVFAVIVVIFHAESFMVDGVPIIMYSGRLACEFFFIVCGFLMAHSAEKILSRGDKPNIGKESERFIFRKFCSLYPAVIVGDILYLIVHCIVRNYSLIKSIKRFIVSTPCFFLLHYTGINTVRINSTWFMSSMLIAVAVLFPLLLRHHSIMRRIGSFLIGCLVLGCLMMNTSDLTEPGFLIGNIIYKGNLRGLAEVSLGIFSYEMCKELKNVNFTKAGRFLITFTELGLYAAIFLYILFFYAGKLDYFVIFAILAAVTLSFSDISFGSHLFNNPVCYFLGKSSLYIYVSHSAAEELIGYIADARWGNGTRFILYFILTALFTTLVWLLSNLCRRGAASLKKIFIKA